MFYVVNSMPIVAFSCRFSIAAGHHIEAMQSEMIVSNMSHRWRNVALRTPLI
jgi:hypothetical protein